MPNSIKALENHDLNSHRHRLVFTLFFFNLRNKAWYPKVPCFGLGFSL